MAATIEFSEGYPPTCNDAEFVRWFADKARKLVGEDGYEEAHYPLMASEDFSFVLNKIPGCFAFLGTAPDGVEPEFAQPCHSTKMMLNESAMAIGVATYATVALEYLNGDR